MSALRARRPKPADKPKLTALRRATVTVGDWTWNLSLGVLVLFLCVCAACCGCMGRRPVDPCYAIVGINPNTRVAILFDQCHGAVEYQNLPPMPTPRATPDASAPAATTTTTLPRTAI